MAFITTEVSEIIEATSPKIYEILANYHTHHVAILPKSYFTKLEVENGGIGEGTIARVEMNVMGVKRIFRLEVSETEKGKILTETDSLAGVITSFILDPVDEGRKTRVTIRTKARLSPGLKGQVEKWLNPGIFRKIFRKELAMLADYAKSF